MNAKLVRRAAIKYHDWMIEQAKLPHDNGLTIIKQMGRLITESKEMQKWVDRFIEGNEQRVQVNEWEPTVRHRGIINRRVYENIATNMVPNLGNTIINRTHDVTNLLESMVKPSVVIPLTLKEAIIEIEIIQKEWEDVQFKNGELSILIRDVVLYGEEDVELGSFRIVLNLNNPLENLTITSIDKFESASGYYHPHVDQRGDLCAGDGEPGMTDAICQGRLEDYFRLVEAILRTYNSSSPYEALNFWYESNHEDEFFCEACVEWRSNDESCYCSRCEINYCEHCGSGDICCECNEWHCDNCVSYCSSCEETLCHGCEALCNDCGDSYCSNCLNNCASCGNRHCESCLSSCNNCGDSICADCTVICKYCEENNCASCTSTCEHCGIAMCGACSEEHDCLLSEVSDMEK